MAGHEILLNIIGGVALLLWAVRMIRTGIMRAYGARLRQALSGSAQNRLAAFGAGVGAAAALQSATGATLLAISFVQNRLIGLATALAVILGADLGSTLVVQVLSFDIAWLSPVLIAGGVISFMTSEKPIRRHLGRAAIGLGLVLLALQLVVGVSEPLRESASLQAVLQALGNDPILAVVVAAALTWLAHSSVAMVLLIMSLTASGVIALPLGMALVLGANIGTALVAIGLTAQSSVEARRLPYGNLLFRALGMIAVLPVIDLLLPLLSQLGGEPGRQIANFHTAFNLALAIVFLPLLAPIAALLVRVFREPSGGGVEPTVRHLDEGVLGNPKLALACATREVMRMADVVETMLKGSFGCFESEDPADIERIRDLDDKVDELHEEIKLYATKISRNKMSEEESRDCTNIIIFTTNLEHIGDIIENSLMDLAKKRRRNQLNFSDEGYTEICEFHAGVVRQMQVAMSVFVSRDPGMARALIEQKTEFREQERLGSLHHLDRLRDGRPETIETSALHMDILRDLKRIHSHLTSVAYPILDAAGELRPTRLRPARSEETRAAGE
ncbi:MAG: Na/Pi cotransporter family protein [Rhodovibrionaceae bacterium]